MNWRIHQEAGAETAEHYPKAKSGKIRRATASSALFFILL